MYGPQPGTEYLWNSGATHPTTINLRRAAVRRLAYEAADCGLLSADLAAGIRRVKGAKRLGVPVGNWLTAERGKRMLSRAFEASAIMQHWRFCWAAGYVGRN